MAHSLEHKIIFLDIETVPAFARWEDVPEEEKVLWEKKTRFQRKEELSAAEYYPERAGILAEFSKIICISCVYYLENKFQIQSFYGDSEHQLLLEFSTFLEECKDHGLYKFCAHNGKEFDFPVLARRFLINDLDVPKPLRLSGKKPWEIPHLDTMEMWRFGDFKNFTSLELLAYLLGVPTPKSDIDGSQVAQVYYEEKDLERIREYCERDATTVLRVFQKLVKAV